MYVLCMYVCMYVCIHVCIHVCTYVYMYVLHKHTYVFIYRQAREAQCILLLMKMYPPPHDTGKLEKHKNGARARGDALKGVIKENLRYASIHRSISRSLLTLLSSYEVSFDAFAYLMRYAKASYLTLYHLYISSLFLACLFFFSRSLSFKSVLVLVRLFPLYHLCIRTSISGLFSHLCAPQIRRDLVYAKLTKLN